MILPSQRKFYMQCTFTVFSFSRMFWTTCASHRSVAYACVHPISDRSCGYATLASGLTGNVALLWHNMETECVSVSWCIRKGLTPGNYCKASRPGEKHELKTYLFHQFFGEWKIMYGGWNWRNSEISKRAVTVSTCLGDHDHGEGFVSLFPFLSNIRKTGKYFFILF